MPYIPQHLRTSVPPTDPDSAAGWLAWQLARQLPSTGRWVTLVRARNRFRQSLALAMRGHAPEDRCPNSICTVLDQLRADDLLVQLPVDTIAWMVEQEWYRRVVGPYEDGKVVENGDVWHG